MSVVGIIQFSGSSITNIMSKQLSELFGGERSEGYNVLQTALENVAKSENMDIYTWLDQTPKTPLVTFLVDEIRRLGYDIKKHI